MNKRTIISFLGGSLLLVGVAYTTLLLKRHSIIYPKYLHNSCTGKWAVEDEDGYYSKVMGTTLRYRLGDSGEIYEYYDDDTVLKKNIGNEITFDDSLSAVKFYKGQQRAKVVRDSTAISVANALVREKFIKDSIWRCHHTYN